MVDNLKGIFPDAQALLGFYRQTFNQNVFIENLHVLLERFPELCPEYFKKEGKIEIDGLCNGLCIAFEVAYLQGELPKHVLTYAAIANANKTDLQNKAMQADWLEFISNILQYQVVGLDVVDGGGLPIKDRKCLASNFFVETWEEVLKNALTQTTLQNGMILVYFPSDPHYHAISIREVNDYWYLYDPNQAWLVKSFGDAASLGEYLSEQISIACMVHFISLDKSLEAVIDADFLHCYLASLDSNPIVPPEQIIKEENFHPIALQFLREITGYKCTILHLVFSKQVGLLMMPLFQRLSVDEFSVIMQVQDRCGYTPFMMMFMHNPEVIEAIMEIFYQDQQALCLHLALANAQQENGLFFVAYFRPDIVLTIFAKLPQYKAWLIEIMMAPGAKSGGVCGLGFSSAIALVWSTCYNEHTNHIVQRGFYECRLGHEC